MVWYGAAFHIGSTLVVHKNITLVYSPELNLIKNLWRCLKSHFWNNRSCIDYEELEKTAIEAWQKTVLSHQLI